jgi:hypothetical protein
MRPARSTVSSRIDHVSFSFLYGNLATTNHPDATGGRIELTSLCY